MISKSIFLSAVFLFFMNGCASKSGLFYDTKHEKESQKLNAIMHDLELVVYDDSKSELELDSVRRRYAMTLADTIKDLSSKIEEIPPSELEKKVSKKNRKFFFKYLNQLRKDAKEINEIAQKYELEKLQRKIQSLKYTCNSCHAQLRTYP